MSAYALLLDAAIRDLEDRKSGGERFLLIAPDTLNALAAPPPCSRRPEPAEPARPTVTASRTAPSVAPVRPAPSIAAASVRPLTVTVPTAEKSAAFAELRARVLACVKCSHLVATRQSVVFGVGDLNAQLLFVGEAPSEDDDRLGEPFVGAAGQLLTKIITAMGQTRDTVFIANVLKCRPNPPAGEPGNRKPRPDEMATCLPYLREQIQLIQPRVIVALGGSAVEGLFSMSEAGITRRRGHWMDFLGIPVMPTFHPSYILHAETGADKGLALKRQVWEDMLKVMERLGLPISDKQRGYFR